MKKIILVILMLTTLLLISSCNKEISGNGKITIKNDKLETTFTHENIDEDHIYVLNIKTKKYHLQTCDYAIGMNEANRYETSSMHYITEREYEPCKICIGG